MLKTEKPELGGGRIDHPLGVFFQGAANKAVRRCKTKISAV